MNIMQMTIAKGVPHYNQGNAQACADLYELAAHAMLAMDPEVVGESNRMLRSRAIRNGAHESASDRAWTLRRSFDRIQDRMMAGR